MVSSSVIIILDELLVKLVFNPEFKITKVEAICDVTPKSWTV